MGDPNMPDSTKPEPKKFTAAMGSDARQSPVRIAFVTRRTSPQVKTHDDGYVMTFVADSNAAHSSEVVILDAKNFAAGPIARVQIPQRVPVGFHSTWIPGDQLRPR